VTWAHYAAQGRGLLDHLGIERAHLMGGCMGCSSVAAFAAAHPERTLSMVLFWPTGGPKYRILSHRRFAEHLAYASRSGLQAVVEVAREGGKSFGADPRGGPWASVLRHDEAFAETYAKQGLEKYKLLVAGIARTLIDRDTVCGAEPEDLMRLGVPALIVPGRDEFHATSAARYLEECLRQSEYWDIRPAEQTEENVPARLLEFLRRASQAR
jgi:pimeloyl-ACP methyl ester carboxylesterase